MVGDAFTAGENMVGTGKVQKMNQKTRFRGTGAEVSAMSGNDGPFAGQEAFISSTGSGFTVDKIYRRNNANSAWQEIMDVSNGRAPDATLLEGISAQFVAVGRTKYPGLRFDMIHDVVADDVVATPYKLWHARITSTGAVTMVNGLGSIMRLQTGGTNGSECAVGFNAVDTFRPDMNPKMEVIIDLNLQTDDFELRFGFTDGTINNWIGDSLNFACMEVDTVLGVDNSINIETRDGSTRSRTDTGQNFDDATIRKFRLDLNDTTNVELFLNGTSIGTKTTNLPSPAINLQPFFWLELVGGGSNRTFQIHAVRIWWDDESS